MKMNENGNESKRKTRRELFFKTKRDEVGSRGASKQLKPWGSFWL